jgi:hypothetical protein
MDEGCSRAVTEGWFLKLPPQFTQLFAKIETRLSEIMKEISVTVEILLHSH